MTSWPDAMEVAEHDPERHRDEHCDADRSSRQLELLERLACEEAGVVLDEAERLDEGVEVRGVGERHRRRSQGISARRSAIRSASQVSASATASAPAE